MCVCVCVCVSVRARVQFKRDIIIGAENPRTGKIVAEKMIRFMEDKLRQKDTVRHTRTPTYKNVYTSTYRETQTERACVVPAILVQQQPAMRTCP